ncbi:MAG: hypothetical protein A2X46_00190 [Lentisphaerae bacterium GWF2_57_35]|nr:MAG: hypothetical protein A2X46_00190 [Lentisphaerae bacterium GWF2_57_35]
MKSPEHNALAWGRDGRPDLEWVDLPALGIRMTRVPVSRSAYACFASDYPPGDGPAVNVSWDNAVRFCRWLGERCGAADDAPILYRLPTAAEWESCALGRAVAEPAWKDVCPDFGTDADFAGIEALLRDAGGRFSYSPHAWGLLRPEPPLWEWTGDLYDPEKNCRILRCACWRGRLDGAERTLYHRTPTPAQGRPEVAFRMVQAVL